MAVLTNPVNTSNIFSRFIDYVQATANAGISWGTNAMPFPEFDVAQFGGSTAGLSFSHSIPTTGNIVGYTIYLNLLNITRNFTRIRNLRAIKYYQNQTTTAAGTTTTYTTLYDATAVANMNWSYEQSISVGNTAVAATAITSAGLETLFSNLRTAYSNARANSVTIPVYVCHSNHSNVCHNSRSRR